ncbi:MAG: GDYXXLXY domain-containing protein [Brumimicrobium sp.]|nr:GDYXXLXY domain-containing protein [Brumimicrobium sp.]
MNSKKYLFLTFIIVALVQLAIPIKMIMEHETILKIGKIYRFEIAPIDPSDPFRGKYVIVRLKENSFRPESMDENMQGDIYVLLHSTGPNGFATIKGLSKEKPAANEDFVKAKIDYSYDELVYIRYPFDRYYLNETIAPKVEGDYFKMANDTLQKSYAILYVQDGDAVINDLIINGKSVKDYH